jgi:phenylpropionate dioxygenase-like ring-hydroxylating dioxygenase large terminal subunit
MNKEAIDWSRYWGGATKFGIGGATVPASFYTSQEQFDAEREKIFSKVWLMVGREAEVPEPGDFVRRAIPPLDTEALIVRGKDGVVRAFHNACVHRGVALVRACAGKTGLFTCPYHAWTYGTDGKLRGLPGAEDFPQVDRKQEGLKPIRLDIWNGFVFLNFDEQPQQTLTEFLGDFGDKFGDMPFEGYPHILEISQDIEANWKTLVDASNEGYHVNALHRASLGAMMTTPGNPLNNFYDPIFSGPHMSSTTQANPDWRPDAPVVLFAYAAAAYKTQPGLAAEAAGAAVGRTFADHPMVNRVGLPAFSVETTQIFPFSVLQMLTNRYIWFQYWPVGPNKTRAVTRLYGPAAPENYRQAFAEAHLLAYSRDIMTEDTVVTQLQQIGLKSGGVKQVVLGEHEYMLRFFHEKVLEHLGR